jgi:hypothetical protein
MRPPLRSSAGIQNQPLAGTRGRWLFERLTYANVIGLSAEILVGGRGGGLAMKWAAAAVYVRTCGYFLGLNTHDPA